MNNTGKVIIGNHNIGKTTLLYKIFLNEYKKFKNILVVDSATEHKEKSLIVKISDYLVDDFIWIDSCEKSKITFPNSSIIDYPYSLISTCNSSRIFLADVSKYLEDGYNYPDGYYRQVERTYYKKLSMQIIIVLCDKVDVIIMDEVELIPESKAILEYALAKGVDIYISLHETKSLAGLDYLFSTIRVDQC